MGKKIFIQIAAYKDPQLKHTVLSAINTADNPKNLYFGICWQDDRSMFNNLKKFISCGNISLTCVDAKDTKGIGWARERAQALYNGEEYVLQIDSHMRFENKWDTDCKKMLSDCQSEKPLLTTYLPDWHNLTKEQQSYHYPMGMTACEFHPEWSMLLLCGNNEPLHLSPVPVKGAFLSSHFVFTTPDYFKEVKIDPQMGFGYEEAVMGVRSFTHGWDVYAPNKIVCRHTWDRWIRKLVWEDQPKEYLGTQSIAYSRYRQLTEIEDYGIDLKEYGIGKERTLQEYEGFSGVDFKNQKITEIVWFTP
jgi:Glycosyltransferase (GlcNAc)